MARPAGAAAAAAAPLPLPDFGALLALPATPLLRSIAPAPFASCAYVAAALAAPDAARLAAAIDAAAAPAQWVELRGRRLLQFGGQPLPGGMRDAAPLPPFLAAIAARLVAAGVFPAAFPPNHVLVNDYACGEGILAHSDGPRYHPVVATLSLLDASVMRFSVLYGREAPGERGGAVVGELLLAAGSLVVTWGELYSRYAHAIAEERESVLGPHLWNPCEGAQAGDRFAREGRRLSVTIRHAFVEGAV